MRYGLDLAQRRGVNHFTGLMAVVVALKRLEARVLIVSLMHRDSVHLVGEVCNRVTNNALARNWAHVRAIIKLSKFI